LISSSFKIYILLNDFVRSSSQCVSFKKLIIVHYKIPGNKKSK